MTHYYNLKKAPFEAIRSGEKVYELRLYDEKRKLLSVGDEIVFDCGDYEETLRVRVKKLHIFGSFEELYKVLPLEKCGYKKEELAAASYKDMEEYYPRERQENYGVVGIETELI